MSIIHKVSMAIFKPTPRGKVRWTVFFIIVLALIAGLYDYPTIFNNATSAVNSQTAKVSWLNWLKLPTLPDYKFHLGLDLQGGAHLVYEADVKDVPAGDQDDAMNGVRDVIERRVNAFGVAEPLIQTIKSGDSRQVVVELAGVKDINQAIKMIGETPVLEFKEENQVTAQSLTDDQRKEMDDYNKKAKTRTEDIIKEISAGKETDFRVLAEKYSEDAATKNSGGSLGLISKNGAYGTLWSWADKNGAGKISAVPVEDASGFNILAVDSEKESGKEVQARHILICYKGADRCDKDTSKEDALKKIKELKQQATSANFNDLAKANSTEPGAAQSGGDLGSFGPGEMVKPFEDAAMPLGVNQISDVVETQFGYHLIFKTGERPLKEYSVSRILIRKKTEADYLPSAEPWKFTGLTGKQLKKAALDFDPTTGSAQVGIEFNDEGKQLFAEVTKRNVNKPVAIFLDGEAISVPRVNEPILEGKAVISGNFTVAEAKLLVQRLNAGALPVPIKLISQETVSATLGNASVQKSLFAGIVGFALIALFMILYYRLPGFLSVLALCVYIGLTLAIFKLIPITLSLAGIAGFILTIGMAVDANVLIFERLKEELRTGKTLYMAIDEAFKRAFPSIWDGNLTTLMGALILFWFSTSMVKGFGLTLSIGIIVSIFTALTVTKAFLRLTLPWIKNEWWYSIKKIQK
ncbi:MAG: protein translocase subunit SecD [bacterium]|nr:protein translocase subunit SecD [bacterium]